MYCSKSPVVTELEYMEPLWTVLESGSTTIISCAPLRERALDHLRSMDLLRPLLGADAVAVESVDDRVPLLLIRGVPGRQIDDDVTIDSVALEIAFERGAVYFDFLDRNGFRTGFHGRDLGLHL